jgi:hypothetical protein
LYQSQGKQSFYLERSEHLIYQGNNTIKALYKPELTKPGE